MCGLLVITPVVPFEIPKEDVEQNKASNKISKWFKDKFAPNGSEAGKGKGKKK